MRVAKRSLSLLDILPTIMGAMKQSTGAFSPGFLLLAVFALGAAGMLRLRQAPAGSLMLEAMGATEEF